MSIPTTKEIEERREREAKHMAEIIPLNASYQEIETYSTEIIEKNIPRFQSLADTLKPLLRDYHTRRLYLRRKALVAECKAIIKGRNKPKFIDLRDLQ